MKICIVEDNARLLENLRILLEGEPGVTVEGVYPTAEAALAAFPWNGADTLLVDLDLPGMSGGDFIRRVAAQVPELGILVYTVFEDRDTVFNALKAGAVGYLLKGCPPRELVESLRILHAGGAPMSPKIARKVIREFQSPGMAKQDEPLTPRERGILAAIAQGHSYKDIARDVGISAGTVHSHIKRIYHKLQAGNRAEAIAKARRMGVL